VSGVYLAHNWFMSRRGGERTVEEIAGLFPGAGVATLFLKSETLPEGFSGRQFQVSALGWLAPRFFDHRKLLPLYPWAVRRMVVPEGTRLLVSSDAAVIKGLRKPPGCVQVCYCHSPPRYLWEMTEEYAKHTSGLGRAGRWLFRKVAARVGAFDREAADGVDYFVANSHFVAERILRCYGREAVVVYPPVRVELFTPSAQAEDFYLIVSELVSYKRVDIAVEACTQTGRKLVVVGQGAEVGMLRKMAGPTVRFTGRLGDGEVADLMQRCRAFLYPQIEDFGITAVEAQAAGRPVIALGRGGALETVVDGVTGCFFKEQTVVALVDALRRFEANEAGFDPAACRKNAERFSVEIFRSELRKLLARWVPEAGL